MTKPEKPFSPFTFTEVKVQNDPFTGPPKDRVCSKCSKRTATGWWAPDGVVGAVHGSYAAWCQVCILETQIAFARDAAQRLPYLEKELQDYLHDESLRAKFEADEEDP